MKSFFLSLGIIGLVLSACGLNPTIVPANTPSKQVEITSTSTPLSTPTDTVEPTQITIFTSTATPFPSNEPGLIVTLGEKVDSPWYPGISVFSPDGKIIVLASSRIRFWSVNSHELIRELKNPYLEGCYLENAKFSPDGKYFAVSISGCWQVENPIGHLLVWNMSTGDLIQEWTQEYAYMPPSSTTSWEYHIPVYGMAFLPNSTTLVYSNGHSLEIRDIIQPDQHDVLKLGPKMFASQISISSDGQVAHVVMYWQKDLDFPAKWTWQFKFQSWNLYAHTMVREIKYPEGWATSDLELLETALVHANIEEGTSQLLNLETNESRDLPYRKGWRYYNSDGNLAIYARLIGFNENEQAIELWNTDNWRNIYTFMPNFGYDWIYGMHGIVFSPDNTILAIEHQEQVTLWNISPVVHP